MLFLKTIKNKNLAIYRKCDGNEISRSPFLRFLASYLLLPAVVTSTAKCLHLLFYSDFPLASQGTRIAFGTIWNHSLARILRCFLVVMWILSYFVVFFLDEKQLDVGLVVYHIMYWQWLEYIQYTLLIRNSLLCYKGRRPKWILFFEGVKSQSEAKDSPERSKGFYIIWPPRTKYFGPESHKLFFIGSGTI